MPLLLAVSLDEQSVAAAAAVTLPPHNVPTTPPHHPTQEHIGMPLTSIRY